MNSAVSKLSNSRAFGYFRYKVREHKPRLIITSIMAALTYPLFFIVLAMTYGMDNMIFGAFMASALPIGILALQVYVVMGIVIPVSSMPYLHKRTMADLGFSIPLSTKQRFWGDFFAGLFVYTIPYIISMIVGIVIYLFPYISDKEDLFTEAPPWNIFTYMLSGLVIAIMVYILSYFISVFTGSSVVASIYIIIINAIIPITLALVSWAIFTSVYGVDYTEIIQGVITDI